VPNLLTTATHPEEILETLIRFSERIQDIQYCRSRCKIDGFLQRHRATVDQWISEADTVRGDASTAMRKSGPQAAAALTRGLQAWSCRDCAKLGDWIIALDCPQDLQVEYLDHIFDYLCPTRGLARRKHPPDRIGSAPASEEAAERTE